MVMLSSATLELTPLVVTSSTRALLAPSSANPPPTICKVWPSVTLMVMASLKLAKVMLPVRVMTSSTPSVLPVAMALFRSAMLFTAVVTSRWSYPPRRDRFRALLAAIWPVAISRSQSPPLALPPVLSSEAAMSAPVMPASLVTKAWPSLPAPTSQP